MNTKQLLNVAKALNQFDGVIEVIDVNESMFGINIEFRLIGDIVHQHIQFYTSQANNEEEISHIISNRIKKIIGGNRK